MSRIVLANREAIILDKQSIINCKKQIPMILSHKRQCEDGHYQRTNTVSATFPNTTPMQSGSNLESVEKVVDFTKNADVGLCLGVNAAMNHLSPFLLILLCFVANSL